MNDIKKKILIVEDEVFLREICAKQLSKDGFEISEAQDGEEALKKVEEVKPDLVLLDIILPLIDGFGVLKKIRENSDEKIKNVPIIMLTNLGQEEDIKNAMALGATEYMVKSYFTTEEIEAKIKKMLGL